MKYTIFIHGSLMFHWVPSSPTSLSLPPSSLFVDAWCLVSWELKSVHLPRWPSVRVHRLHKDRHQRAFVQVYFVHGDHLRQLCIIPGVVFHARDLLPRRLQHVHGAPLGRRSTTLALTSTSSSSSSSSGFHGGNYNFWSIGDLDGTSTPHPGMSITPSLLWLIISWLISANC